MENTIPGLLNTPIPIFFHRPDLIILVSESEYEQLVSGRGEQIEEKQQFEIKVINKKKLIIYHKAVI